MSKTIAFLRAINVGGHTVKMEHLRQLFESLGLTEVETFIASGNVVFESIPGDTRLLEAEIADHLHKSLGYPVAVFIRTGAELVRLAAFQAFPKADLEAAAALNIAFLAKPLDDKSKQKLWALKTDIDDFAAQEREIYWLCRKKQSQSTFSNAVLEKTLALQSTLRGVNTVRKMAARYAPRS
jgi:uncharacterized protein (DUF1697 family)